MFSSNLTVLQYFHIFFPFQRVFTEMPKRDQNFSS